MKTLLFDTRLPEAAIAEILKAGFQSPSPPIGMGHGDAGTKIFSVSLRDEEERERFRTIVRTAEVELGLRESVSPRARPGVYDFLDSKVGSSKKNASLEFATP